MASIRDLLTPTDNGSHAKLGIKEEGKADNIDNTSETTQFTVEFILDVLCPWCYIGLKNLNNAITDYKDRHPGGTFEIICSPFLLDPLAPRSERYVMPRPYPLDPTLAANPRIGHFLFSLPYDKQTYLNAPKYSIDQWAALGEPVGIKFSWKGRTGNTRDAHKLLRYALESTPTSLPSTAFASRNRPRNQGAAPPASPTSGSTTASVSASVSAPAQTDVAVSSTGDAGAHSAAPSSPSTPTSTANVSQPQPQPRGPALQLRVLEALFKWHHEHDGDLSDRASLAATGAAVTGFSAAELLAVFESEEWGRAVDELFLDVTGPRGRRGLNVRAVPTFIVNDRYVIGGLQSREFFVEEFERIARAGGRGGGEGGGKGKGVGMGGEGGGGGTGSGEGNGNGKGQGKGEGKRKDGEKGATADAGSA